jgi:hypothetical protein
VQVLFGTWHRPYLALYEQALYANAKEVIAKFPSGEQQKWQSALSGFRMPYFDWAMEPTVSGEYVPKVIRDEKIEVTKPTGKVSINNPLYSYSFGSSIPSEMGWAPKNGFPTTLRHPTGTKSNNDEMNRNFGSARVGWRQRLFALFSSKQPWGVISTAQYGVKTARQNTDSFESVHDEIHGTAGGNEGWMGYLDVAAFDPIFWLHHVNIDRLLTMHQLLVPNTWVTNGTISIDTAQWNAGEMKDENSPLKPFMKDTSGAYYTSRDVKETRLFGYYYTETEGNDASSVIAAINKLYGQGEKAMAGGASQSSSKVSSSTKASSSSSKAASSSSKAASSAKASSSAGSSKASATSAASSGAALSSAAASSKASSSTKGGAGVSITIGGPSKASSTAKVSSKASATKSSSGHSSQPTHSTGNGHFDPFPGRPFRNGDYDTVLSVIGDKFGMPGSWKVWTFLGNKPGFRAGNNHFGSKNAKGASDPIANDKRNSTTPSTGNKGNSTSTPLTNGTTNYFDHPDYVGSHTFLGGSVAKTNSSAPVLTEGSIPLTACLQGKVESGELESLHPDHVEPYLKENLHYKIVGPNGQEFEPEKVPNFHATVKSCPVEAAPEGQLPIYKEYIDLPRVNLPASAPWTPPAASLPPPTTPVGSMPWMEAGYCVSSQTVEYVDCEGNFLYRVSH